MILFTRYEIRDHLGSVRTIVNASGTVVERNDYYPFGTRTTFGASYATLAANRQKFSGKEDQTAVAGSTLPYLDFGARMYDSKLVRWNTYDPMAEKYYGINPYVYCNGDPVNMMDPDGSIVKPKKEVEMIRNTLPKEAWQFVQLTKEGFIDGKLLSKYKGRSQNYSRLAELVESDYLVFVSLSDSFNYLDNNGKKGIHTMRYFPFDSNYPEDRDLDFQSVTGITTGESGFLGKVLFPDREGLENSTTPNIEIYIHKSLSTVGAAETFSHEAYGHALRYIRTAGDHQEASHKINGTIDKNIELKRMIIESRRETVKNLTR